MDMHTHSMYYRAGYSRSYWLSTHKPIYHGSRQLWPLSLLARNPAVPCNVQSSRTRLVRHVRISFEKKYTSHRIHKIILKLTEFSLLNDSTYLSR